MQKQTPSLLWLLLILALLLLVGRIFAFMRGIFFLVSILAVAAFLLWKIRQGKKEDEEE